MVSVNDFYHFPLTPADFTASTDPLNGAVLFPNNPLSQSGFAPGDFAILVAMHVATREVPNWTWQTFWWTLDTPAIPAPINGASSRRSITIRLRSRIRIPQDGLNSANLAADAMLQPVSRDRLREQHFRVSGSTGNREQLHQLSSRGGVARDSARERALGIGQSRLCCQWGDQSGRSVSVQRADQNGFSVGRAEQRPDPGTDAVRLSRV